MENNTVDKNRLRTLISLASFLVSLTYNIDCSRCKFYHNGCYFRMNELREVHNCTEKKLF